MKINKIINKILEWKYTWVIYNFAFIIFNCIAAYRFSQGSNVTPVIIHFGFALIFAALTIFRIKNL